LNLGEELNGSSRGREKKKGGGQEEGGNMGNDSLDRTPESGPTWGKGGVVVG